MWHYKCPKSVEFRDALPRTSTGKLQKFKILCLTGRGMTGRLTSLRPMPTLADVVDILHEWYPPDTAMDFDAVGLVAGDPTAAVARVMFAVDPTIEVAREAVEWGADLLVVHHPLFLTPVSSVAATTPKGRTWTRSPRAGAGA